MCAVELKRGGLHLTGTPLWLDATRKSELSFVSHAHADHIAKHERVIATGPTLRLMGHRLGKGFGALPAPYHRPFELGPLNVELLPAGHILGSAQLRVTLGDGRRVVYTGDFSLSTSRTAEACAIAECDTLVMEATFGHPRYRFPDRAEVLEQVFTWCEGLLARGVTPILLGYVLGKSQEVARGLTERGFAVCAHPKIHEMISLYQDLGVPMGEVRKFDGTVKAGEVALFPPHRARAYSAIWPRRTAMLSGWAVDANAFARHGADDAFPLSDHADFPQLLRYAKESGASEILTCHGQAEVLAEALRGQGLNARAVGRPHQLELFRGENPPGEAKKVA
jgi:putative mRNA 3-end processing factor